MTRFGCDGAVAGTAVSEDFGTEAGKTVVVVVVAAAVADTVE